ncbi:MAG: alpha/beta fold hydrolase [Sandaracinaceae bacterium]
MENASTRPVPSPFNGPLQGGPTRPRAAPATSHEQLDVTVHGLRLRYVDVPASGAEEGPPVLLIHGHASRIEEYERFIPHLRGRRRVLVPDLPGCGYSEKPDRPYHLRLYEDTLLAFLDRLGVDRADLAGGSLGGNLVLRLGHREKDRFGKLAAWAPAGAWTPRSMRGMALLGRVMKRLPFMFWPSLWVQSRFWYSPDWEGREASYRSIWSFTKEVYGPAFRRMYWEIGVDQALQTLFDRAHEIEHQTYLAVGDKDTALAMDRGVRRLSTMVPNASFRVWEGARHALANEIPHLLGPDVDRFLHGQWQA